MSYINNRFKMLSSTLNKEFELSNGSYSVSDIQDYVRYILEQHWKKISDNNNPPIEIYINEIKNRITLKTKTGYCLDL